MEALRELERLQKALSLLQSRGISTADHDSDRFLARLILFLVEPCGVLNIDKKYSLISENLLKISHAVLEDALLSETEEEFNQNAELQQTYTEIPFQLPSKKQADLCFLGSEVEGIPKIGFDAMQRANSTLEDFCRSYFMFHGMNVNNPQSIFQFLPVLSFTECYIYQLDTMNEKDLHSLSEEAANNSMESYKELAEPEIFVPLVGLLQSHGLVTERIQSELRGGSEYWALERKLCHALKRKKKIFIEDVMRAIHLKSFDYRVLNLLLYQLRGQQVNDLHMEFLSVSEFLIEISDDLYDYEDDVIENSFNILRMFAGVYGASLAPGMLAKCITEAEEKYECLTKTLDPDLSLNYWKRCEQAAMEGGKTSGHAFGTWNIPCVIGDEESYRMQAINSKASVLKV